ncbi:hypothetical protein EYF80_046811 [Liparis tanakae]|uniref:Uncharacterized protein n=1 Tax=Liparis tanakae TaxID=230148 RepID=A0A4Z2FQ35_9TELE|nr:hypothetical protein EYF80_046811 [Liparis tanakae]
MWFSLSLAYSASSSSYSKSSYAPLLSSSRSSSCLIRGSSPFRPAMWGLWWWWWWALGSGLLDMLECSEGIWGEGIPAMERAPGQKHSPKQFPYPTLKYCLISCLRDLMMALYSPMRSFLPSTRQYGCFSRLVMPFQREPGRTDEDQGQFQFTTMKAFIGRLMCGSAVPRPRASRNILESDTLGEPEGGGQTFDICCYGYSTPQKAAAHHRTPPHATARHRTPPHAATRRSSTPPHATTRHHTPHGFKVSYLVRASVVEAQVADGGHLGVQHLLLSLQLLLHLPRLGEGLGHGLVVAQTKAGVVVTVT